MGPGNAVGDGLPHDLVVVIAFYKENTTRACEEFGPLIVSIDSYGRNYFEEKKVEYNRRKEEQIAKISSQVGFIK